MMRLFGKYRPTAEQHFHSSSYLRHNASRQEHLATLGLDLNNKSVLEVGAGIGDHTTFFLDRGCEVLCTAPRGCSGRSRGRRIWTSSAVTSSPTLTSRSRN